MTGHCGNCVHHLPTRFGEEWLLCRATADMYALYCKPAAVCAYAPARFVAIVVSERREGVSA